MIILKIFSVMLLASFTISFLACIGTKEADERRVYWKAFALSGAYFLINQVILTMLT